MSNYRPYIYWTKTQLAEHLKHMSHCIDVTKEIRTLLDEALMSDKWDPTMDYDGCTAVQDMYHPCISCFLHDYLWRTGQGGKESDELFYYLMLKENIHPRRARRRWLAVRVGWIFWFKWWHFKKRNVDEYSEAFIDALLTLRKDYAGRKAK